MLVTGMSAYMAVYELLASYSCDVCTGQLPICHPAVHHVATPQCLHTNLCVMPGTVCEHTRQLFGLRPVTMGTYWPPVHRHLLMDTINGDSAVTCGWSGSLTVSHLS